MTMIPKNWLNSDKQKKGFNMGAGMLAMLLFLLFCFAVGGKLLYSKWQKAEDNYQTQLRVIEELERESLERSVALEKAQLKLDTLIKAAENKEKINIAQLESIRNENSKIQTYRHVSNDELVRLYKMYKPN